MRRLLRFTPSSRKKPPTTHNVKEIVGTIVDNLQVLAPIKESATVLLVIEEYTRTERARLIKKGMKRRNGTLPDC